MADVDVNFILEEDEPIQADFEVQPDVTYTADIVMSSTSMFHDDLFNRDLPDQHPMSAITGLEDSLESKVDKTNEGSKVYGTDENGDQTTYDLDSFGKVDDVQVGGVSVVTNKIAELGTMAGETASDYSTKAVADTLYADISYEETINNHIADKNNPHAVTKTQVGLGNCDNTSDLDKPISTATQTALNGKQDTISDLSTIRENATHGESAYNTIGGYGDIVTHNTSEFATAAQGALADTALQAGDNISELVNNAGYITGITSSDITTALGYTPYDNTNPDGFISGIDSSDVTTALGYTPYDASNPAGYITSGSIPTNYVTTDTAQTIGVQKAFSQPLVVADGVGVATGTILSNKKILQKTSNGVEVGNSTEDIKLIGKSTTTRPQYNSNDLALYSDIPTLADLTTQTQLDAINSGANATNIGQITTNANDISDIQDLIPSQASDTNQLADKDFVNSSIATNTAKFIGTFANVTDLESYAGTVTNNDYAFVVNSVVEDNGSDWSSFSDLDNYDKSLLTNFDYGWVINGSNFDLYRFDIVDQSWDLRASDISKTSVTLNTAYNRYKATVISNVTTWDYEYTLNNSSFTATQWAAINSGVTTADVALAQSALQSGDNISELVNDAGYITSASLPTVNDATLTIQKNGTTEGTFTANASSNVTVNITVPTDTNDLTNGAGFITGITSSDVTTALGYTPYDDTNPDGFISGITSGDVTTALGYTPYDNSNPDGFISGITSSDVTTALGYTPYNSTNPSGYITGIDSTDVTTALGYTPVDPSNLATVATSGDYDDLLNKPTIPASQVNSDWNAVSGVAEILNKPTLGTMASQSASDYTPTASLATVATSGLYSDLSGTPTIPTVDQTYDGTSANAQSGVAIAGAGFLTSSDVTSSVTFGSTSPISSGGVYSGTTLVTFRRW